MKKLYPWHKFALITSFMLVSLISVLPAQSLQRVRTGLLPAKLRVFNPDKPDHPQKISRKNILYSLILPGAGEWAAGHRTAAKIFMGADLSLVAGIIGSKAYARQLERDFQGFAGLHAGINVSGKNNQYWIDIGNATDIFAFNERRRVQRNLRATWPETDFYFWQWDSEKNRFKYADLRSKQHNWENAATFMVAGMIVNRLVSAVNVLRLVRKHKIKKDQTRRKSFLRWDFANTRPRGGMVRLNWTYLF